MVVHLAPGSRLGHFEISAQIGEGGMGVVFKAKDSQLGREVALKVLPERFTADPERLARFEREAKLLASLNHPNIAQIYGVERGPDGTRALVMELVEGPTLAERLAHGSLPLDESLSIARQIAEALEEAHEKGIVHRDLKPQNIKTSLEGKVKVLDFGLAKALDPTAASGAVSPPLPSNSPALMNSPTLASAMGGTGLGVILGTAAYMSPEQARGRPIDRRADIWAFGCVLWEMLTGKQLFEGETVSDTLAAVLRQEIAWSALPAELPAPLRELLRRCLERDPKRRLRDIGDARLVLEDGFAGSASLAVAAPAPRFASTAPRAALLALACLAIGALGALGAARFARRPGSSPTLSTAAAPRLSFRQLTKLPGGEGQPSLSPDGESFLFVKRDGEDRDVFLQRVDGRKVINLTEECAQDDRDAAFSPDGRSIAYHSECGGGGIFVMGATGESARRVTELGFAPAWSPDGRELAVVAEELDLPTSRNTTSELWVVRLADGNRRRASAHDAMGPSWSPHGHRIAFWGLRRDTNQRDLYTVAADGSQGDAAAAVPLLDDAELDWDPVWSPDGLWIYFASSRGGTLNLWRIPVDELSGAARGAPEPLTAPSRWAGPISISRDGRRLVYTDRNAETVILRAPIDPVRRALGGPPTVAIRGSFEFREQQLSPDGTWIAFSNEDLPQHVHLVRADGTGYRQLTEGDDRNRQGAWSPDGARLVLQTTREGAGLVLLNVDGSGWQRLAASGSLSTPIWSPDGATIYAFDSEVGGVALDVRAGGADVTRRVLPRIDADRIFWPNSTSPDGRRLLGVATDVSGRSDEIALLDLATGGYRLRRSASAPNTFQTPVFVTDRLYCSASGGQLLLVDHESGAPVTIYSAPPGHTVQNQSASADGRWLTWIERSDESDIWLATIESETGAAN